MNYSTTLPAPFNTFNFTKHIRGLRGKSPLQDKVIEILLSSDQPDIYATDIISNGCISGVVPELVYYTDTEKFFDTFYSEIDELRQDYEFETLSSMKINGNLKNYLAWFAFELITQNLINSFPSD